MALPTEQVVNAWTAEPDDPGERPLSPLEAAQVGSLWRLARRKVGSNFDDPFEDLAPAAQNAPPGSLPPAGAFSSGNRKLKTSHFCDQADDTEVLRAEPPTVAKWYSNYSRIMHGDPPEDMEPTEDQVTVLNARIKGNGVPYCDFAIWTPCNTKIARSLKFRAWIPQADGTFLAKELAGPNGFVPWESSFNVFGVAMMMLNQMMPATVTEYLQRIRSLSLDWPESWGWSTQPTTRAGAYNWRDAAEDSSRRPQQAAPSGT